MPTRSMSRLKDDVGSTVPCIRRLMSPYRHCNCGVHETDTGIRLTVRPSHATTPHTFIEGR
jgi:hypothetical protein